MIFPSPLSDISLSHKFTDLNHKIPSTKERVSRDESSSSSSSSSSLDGVAHHSPFCYVSLFLNSSHRRCRWSPIKSSNHPHVIETNGTRREMNRGGAKSSPLLSFPLCFFPPHSNQSLSLSTSINYAVTIYQRFKHFSARSDDEARLLLKIIHEFAFRELRKFPDSFFGEATKGGSHQLERSYEARTMKAASLKWTDAAEKSKQLEMATWTKTFQHTVEPRSKASAYKAMPAYKVFKKNP